MPIGQHTYSTPVGYNNQGYQSQNYPIQGQQTGYSSQPYSAPGQQAYGGGGYGHQIRPPPPMQAIPQQSFWKSATAADGQTYYYNEKTGETQWDKPPGL